MLQGDRAKYYRLTASGIQTDQLVKYMDIEEISMVEDESKCADIDTVLKYYQTINKIKRDRVEFLRAEKDVKPPAPIKEMPPAKAKRSRKKSED